MSARQSASGSKARAAQRGDHSSADRVQVDPKALREVKAREYLLRFGFGAAIATVAGLVGLALGPRAGGLFLAFPGTLPASLTLVEAKESTDRACADIKGGTLGGFGLVAFAGAGLALVAKQPAVALLVALLAWTLVSSGLYFLLRHTWVLKA